MTSPARPTIGLRLPSHAGSSAIRLLDGVVEFTKEHGAWQLVSESFASAELAPSRIGVGWQGHGVILFRATEAELDDFGQRQIPVVLLSTEGPDHDFPRVLPDNQEAGKMAATELLGLGHSSFAFVSRREIAASTGGIPPAFRYYARERLAGFRAELARHGASPVVHYLPDVAREPEHDWQSLESAMGAFLETLPPRTGLFAVDDALANVALRAAADRNLTVPDDLSIISFGDDPFLCQSSVPSLTSIGYPAHTIGYKAAQILARQLDHDHTTDDPLPRVPPGPVTHRESTATLTIDDPETARLVRWIREMAPHHAIQVADLEEVSAWSPSTIKQRIKTYLGHTPKTEIKRVRLAHLTTMLKDSEKSLGEIAAAMRFPSAHEMSRFFFRETGENPTSYRSRNRNH